MRRWSRQEDAKLTRLYRIGVPRQRIAAALERSVDAVDARRRTLKIPAHPTPRPWSAVEDALLEAADKAGLPIAQLSRRLGRTAGMVRWRRRTLGLQRRGARAYSPTEDEALRQAWSQGGDLAELGSRLGRSPAALRVRAGKLGLTRPTRRRRWQPNEDRRLAADYRQRLTCAAIAACLGRTEGAVAARARKLGLATYARRWLPDEETQLARLAEQGVPLEQAACILVRTPQALRMRARRLGIKPPPASRHPNRRRRWTPAEDELLGLQTELDPARLALLFGRSDSAVRRRLVILGLRRDGTRSPHYPVGGQRRLSPAQQRLLAREFQPGNGRMLLSLASRLGLSPGAVKELASLPDGAKQPPGVAPMRPSWRSSTQSR